MRNIPKAVKTVVFAFVAVLFVAQAIRIDRTNPPVYSEIKADPAIMPVLRRVCYNCHSNETEWPWYAGLAPVSWLVGSDVHEGRQHLNFSEWGSYNPEKQLSKLDDIRDQIRQGDMPLWYYALMHPKARIKQNEREKILSWTSGSKQ